MDYDSKDQLIETLFAMLEETTLQYKSHATALRVLCLGRDWQHQVTNFEQQLQPQIAEIFVRARRSALEEAHPFPPNWEETVRHLIDGP